jgi:uncharacterized protein (TIGR02001 family)
LAVGSGTAAAQEFSANVALTSDYLFYGYSQSQGWAIQGGFTWTHEDTGIYLGSWASSVDFNYGSGNPASIELDAFIGIAGELSNGLTWDFGGYFYNYPNQNDDLTLGGDLDYIEFYANFGYTFDAMFEPTLKAGVYISPDYFGENGDSYHPSAQLSLSLPEDFGVYGKVGYLDVGDIDYEYLYYKFGVTKSLFGLDFDLSYNDAEAECEAGIDGLCQDIIVFTVSKTF